MSGNLLLKFRYCLIGIVEAENDSDQRIKYREHSGPGYEPVEEHKPGVNEVLRVTLNSGKSQTIDFHGIGETTA